MSRFLRLEVLLCVSSKNCMANKENCISQKCRLIVQRMVTLLNGSCIFAEYLNLNLIQING